MADQKKELSRFAVTLKEIRERHGYSQFKLALAIGKTPSKITQYEQDVRKPTRHGIAELVAAMKATPEEHDELLVAAGFLPDHGTYIVREARSKTPVDDSVLAAAPELQQAAEHLKGEPHPPTETREQMIDRAFRFVTEDPDVKIGSAGMGRYPMEAKLSLVRLYEQHTGRKLLPDDVI
jgi:transcriptional regulator with XRE-family HTH domain